MDKYNFKTSIDFNKKVAVVMHQSEDYGDLSSVTTINELLDKLKKEEYSVTHSTVYNRIYAYNDLEGIGHAVSFDIYEIQ